jgi:hypothetical protein
MFEVFSNFIILFEMVLKDKTNQKSKQKKEKSIRTKKIENRP